MSVALEELLRIMARLRGEGGCPWDREQTFSSIAPFTVEEAYEVADAIERDDMPHLKDELGDLLFQVVFHAQLAREGGHFDFDAVARAICDKLVRRHPHIFRESAVGESAHPLGVEQQMRVWEDIKAGERAAATASAGALDGVPVALPSLMRAFKLSKFDGLSVAETAERLGVARKTVENQLAAALKQLTARLGERL